MGACVRVCECVCAFVPFGVQGVCTRLYAGIVAIRGHLYNVGFLPLSLEILPSHLMQGAIVGNSQTIQCEVNNIYGVDSVIVNWYGPDGNIITNGSRIHVNPLICDNNTCTSDLYITYLMEGDEGIYMCNTTLQTKNISASIVIHNLTGELIPIL